MHIALHAVVCTGAFSGASLGDAIDNFETLAITCFFIHNERDTAINIAPSLLEDDIYRRDRLIYNLPSNREIASSDPIAIQLVTRYFNLSF